jgi:copper chaperone CopZ
METSRLVLSIYGLTDRAEEAVAVQRALSETEGVRHAYVSVLIETAYVEYDPAVVSPDRLAEAIGGAGFGAGEPSVR